MREARGRAKMPRVGAHDRSEEVAPPAAPQSQVARPVGTPAPEAGCARWSSRRADVSLPAARQTSVLEAPGPNLSPHSASRSGDFGHGPCATGVVAPRRDRLCAAAGARYAHPGSGVPATGSDGRPGRGLRSLDCGHGNRWNQGGTGSRSTSPEMRIVRRNRLPRATAQAPRLPPSSPQPWPGGTAWRPWPSSGALPAPSNQWRQPPAAP